MEDESLQTLDAPNRQRRVILSVIRVTFAVLLLTIALLRAAQSTADLSIEWWIPIAVAVAMFGVALTIDLITPNKKISTISSVFLGLLAGMLATIAFGVIIDLLIRTAIDQPQTLKQLEPFVDVIKIMVGLTLCYLGITTVVQTQDDFRIVIPYVEFSKQVRGPRPLLLDTSSLIDARIVDLAATGLIQAPMVVPRFVIGELQSLTDSADKLKRSRGRRGLDVTSRLQRSGLDVRIDETNMPVKGVDQMLIDLARRIPATIVTADVGLSRVAQIQSVPSLNLNDVANALKPSLIPGEQLTLRLIKSGEQPGQGVGYLSDGTMVVVERAGHRIGDDATVLVTSSLQTSAGRMIFAKAADDTVDDGAGRATGDTSYGGTSSADAETDDSEGVANEAEAEPHRGGNLAKPEVSESSGSDDSGERRTGPFPPKPAAKRGSSARNPRR